MAPWADLWRHGTPWCWWHGPARGDTGGRGDMWSACGDMARRVDVGPACGDTAGHGDVSQPHDATRCVGSTETNEDRDRPPFAKGSQCAFCPQEILNTSTQVPVPWSPSTGDTVVYRYCTGPAYELKVTNTS